MKVGNFPRKRYLIDNLQYKLLAINVFYVVMTALVITGALFIPIVLGLDGRAPGMTEDARRWVMSHSWVWPSVALVAAVFVFHTIIVSHRIVGPLYRFRNEFRKIGDGNLFVHVRLRKNDYLNKEADAINQLIDALRSKVRRIDGCQKTAKEMLVDLQRAVIRGSADDVNDRVESLVRVMNDLEASVSAFQIPRATIRVPDKPVEKVEERETEATPAVAGAGPTAKT